VTDSLKITLDLTVLPPHIRQMVPIVVGTDVDQFGEVHQRGFKPIKRQSPLSGAEMMWIVRSESGYVGGVPTLIAKSIDADLNLPSATVGQNLEHGTSVFAAGTAGLWLLKTWLAGEGIAPEYLDRLDTSCIRLRSVTLTYLMRFDCASDAREFVQDVRITAQILHKATKFFESTNETVKMPTKYGHLMAYFKTFLGHCRWPEGAPVDEFIRANHRLARIESMLNREALRALGREHLDSWKNAYSEGLYEELFNKTVVEPLRPNLRHNRPRPEALLKLEDPEQEFVQWYLDGNDPRQFPAVLKAAYPTDAYSKLRLAVLRACDLETNIPWRDHVRLRGYKLRDVLVYPGDYSPEAERSVWCFCRDNWQQLLNRLIDCYRAACTFSNRQPS
jgi:hypothetical protein